MRKLKDLDPHQTIGIDFSLSRDAAYLALEMGLGKTVCALTVAQHWIDHCDVSAILYVAPINVCLSVVEQEIAEWEHLGLKCVFLHGKDKDELIKEHADVYIINPEGIKWLHTVLHRRLRWKCPTFPFSGMVVDEGTKFKGRGVQWLKLKGMFRIFDKRIVMSGRPAPNSLLDLWAQIYLLDQGERLGKSYTSYRKKYFDSDYMGYSWEIKSKKHKKKIYAKVADLMYTVKAKKGMLPKLKFKNVITTLSPANMKAYETFRKKKILEYKEEKLKAKNAMALTTKLRQFSQGLVYCDDRIVNIHNDKYNALKDIIDSANGKPVMVVYNFNHERDYLCEKFKAPYIGGGVSKAERKKLMKEWNKGKIPVLLVHPRSASHGLNLQFGGFQIVFYSPTFSSDDYHQIIARLRRKNQPSAFVIVYHLIAKGTIDHHIYATIKHKDKTHEGLKKAILAYLGE